MFGTQAKLSAVKGVPHHGQALIGAGASLPVRRNLRSRVTAVWSPVLRSPPRTLGEASEPTQRPISIGQSPSSGRPLLVGERRIGAHQLQRADHAGGARQLVERQQAQRVAHDHGDAGAQPPPAPSRRWAIVKAARPR